MRQIRLGIKLFMQFLFFNWLLGRYKHHPSKNYGCISEVKECLCLTYSGLCPSFEVDKKEFPFMKKLLKSSILSTKRYMGSIRSKVKRNCGKFF